MIQFTEREMYLLMEALAIAASRRECQARASMSYRRTNKHEATAAAMRELRLRVMKTTKEGSNKS